MPTRKQRDRLRLGIGRDTDLQRPEPSRESRALAIITNGKCAERKYFEAVKALPWVTATTVRVYFQAGDPRAVVTRAGRLLADGGCDEAWAVCDVDDYSVQLTEVARQAQRDEVGFALSNPCFEVWLILHHGPCARYFADANEVQNHLKKLDPTWDKLRPNFTGYLPLIPESVKSARKNADPLQDNPSTHVWKLIDSMRAPLTADEDPEQPRTSG